jgi:hypothetical protein
MVVESVEGDTLVSEVLELRLSEFDDCGEAESVLFEE